MRKVVDTDRITSDPSWKLGQTGIWIYRQGDRRGIEEDQTSRRAYALVEKDSFHQHNERRKRYL